MLWLLSPGEILFVSKVKKYPIGIHAYQKQARIPSSAFSYQFSTMGGPRFPIAMAAHLNEYFKPHVPVKPESILTGAGLTAIHEMVALSLGDPGDAVLVAPPIYGRFELDFGNTAGLNIVYADREAIDPFSPSIVPQYQKCLDESMAKGIAVKALLIVNPHNPLGMWSISSMSSQMLE